MSSRSKMGTNPHTKLPNTPKFKRAQRVPRARKPSFEERFLGKRGGAE